MSGSPSLRMTDFERALNLAACNGGDDADFVAGLDGRFLVLEKADVLAVDVDVDEAADVALRVEQAFADAGIFLVERGEEFGDGWRRRLRRCRGYRSGGGAGWGWRRVWA